MPSNKLFEGDLRKIPKKDRRVLIEKCLSKAGYTCLEPFPGAHVKWKVRCPKGHITYRRWVHINQGISCSVCAGTCILTHNEAVVAFKDRGFDLLEVYKGTRHAHICRCSYGHNTSKSIEVLRRGYGCAECAGTAPPSSKEVRDLFMSFGYMPTSKYKNSRSKVKFICPKGHKHSVLWRAFKAGVRCGKCAPDKRFEVAAATHLRELLLDFVEQYPVLPFYVDFYIPKYNIFIEIDEYHHKFQKEKDEMRQKYIETKTGIPVYRIPLQKRSAEVDVVELLNKALEALR